MTSSRDPEESLSPEAAAALLIARRKARVHYEDYLKYWIAATRQPFKWGWHMSFLCDIMEAVFLRQEDLRFLNVNIPPRFAKSTILSQQWHCFMIGRDNSARSSLFSISSSMTLASRDSRRTLDTVKSEWYQALFPNIRVGNKETEAEWEITGGAYRIASGREGTVTGRGAHHLLIDDLVSALEGDSEVVREEANEFLGRTLRSRLDDQITGTITNIQQRLHERDATGFLQDLAKTPGGDVYKTIEIPNEAKGKTIVQLNGKIYKVREPGELLHPTYLDEKATAALKVAMRNNYDGQYQQSPTKMEGGHLDPRRIVRLKGSGLELKSSLGLTPAIILDFASTEKETQKNDPDYNVITVGARDQLGRLIILDVWRKQTADYELLARTLLGMVKVWRPSLVRGEKGAMFNQFQTTLNRVSRAMGVYAPMLPLPARTSDKVSRSFAYQGMLNAGVVCVPEDAQWLLHVESSHRAFPRGAHDDVEDTFFDFATHFEALRQGSAPIVDPVDPQQIMDEDYKRRISEAVEAAKNPTTSEDGGWGW